jgi:hypothetical protein
MNNLQDKITETLLNAPSGVHSLLYGFKIKDNEITDIKSLIYCVTEKKPLSALSSNEIIPRRIALDNEQYPTDVVQMGEIVLNQCYDLNAPEPLSLRTRVRPLSGGLEISSLHTWVQVAPYRFSLSRGTLGFLAKDNTDNKLVGVTNNHVIVRDAFINSEKNPSGISSSIIDNIVFSDPAGYNEVIPSRVLQFGTAGGSVNFLNDKIGVPKRYVPISESTPNRVDGALLTIDSNILCTNSQALTGLNTFNMSFATLSEINNLPFNNTLYSAGATTGPKGVNCPLVCFGIGATNIRFNRQGVQVRILFQDCIFFRFLDSSNLPSFAGDSGSAVIADINGQNKIVGLLFAGDGNDDINFPISTFAVASRIDHVANELNISAWDGSNIDRSPINPPISYILTQQNDTRTSIISGGKTFYLAGTVITSQGPTL